MIIGLCGQDRGMMSHDIIHAHPQFKLYLMEPIVINIVDSLFGWDYVKDDDIEYTVPKNLNFSQYAWVCQQYGIEVPVLCGIYMGFITCLNIIGRDQISPNKAYEIFRNEVLTIEFWDMAKIPEHSVVVDIRNRIEADWCKSNGILIGIGRLNGGFSVDYHIYRNEYNKFSVKFGDWINEKVGI